MNGKSSDEGLDGGQDIPREELCKHKGFHKSRKAPVRS